MKGLTEYLERAEIEYIAAHGGGYLEHFHFDKDVAAHARRLGFRVKEFYHDDMTLMEWVRLTNGICICCNDGFVFKGKK